MSEIWVSKDSNGEIEFWHGEPRQTPTGTFRHNRYALTREECSYFHLLLFQLVKGLLLHKRQCKKVKMVEVLLPEGGSDEPDNLSDD